jgi:sorbitol-specific phosphotransferase system component IIC
MHAGGGVGVKWADVGCGCLAWQYMMAGYAIGLIRFGIVTAEKP